MVHRDDTSERRYWQAAAAALAGARPPGLTLTPAEWEPFVRWVVRARLSVLLWQAYHDSFANDPVRAAIETAARQQAIGLALQEQELRRVVEAFSHAGLAPVLIKGAALAYSVYPNALLRPRADVDFIIREADEAETRRVLERAGYAPELALPGRLVSAQFHYTRPDASGVRHACDVHLGLSNTQAYANYLSYEALERDAIPLPRLHEHARGPAPAHSLAIACVHRITHHFADDDLVWLWDIHLLAASLDEAGWEGVLELARARQLSRMILSGLQRAREAFGGTAYDEPVRRLEDAALHEPDAPWVSTSGRTIEVALSDFAGLSTWKARLRLLREHLFPPPSYVRLKYPRCPAPLLPFAYVCRIVRGAPKWLQRRAM